ncbi:pfkb-like carbohydrate kinase family protein [Klebsormidium nitens]|uniref:Pfkb-like carbohydrate kinase family protein n=1 Tax=Klebsormidium nitens TaxID=105231 RepID=A0A1Y1HRY8_KLENI|nr:pfkb-like carbohydrate kinase family protein [Klebsormidium nitens]|eukprot:GAQ81394.1 pfkb-like carbohydrate kinase family protein [Klebsormidium nitens]
MLRLRGTRQEGNCGALAGNAVQMQGGAAISHHATAPNHPVRCAASAHEQAEGASELPEKRCVVGLGGAGIDYLAEVAAYPAPDDKIRTTTLQVQGGGNVGNALTAAARLGLQPRIISKVADDSLGGQILAELEGDGVDTQHMVVAQGGVSPFTYIIVDRAGHTRTCIHTPGQPPMQSHELTQDTISSVLDGADLVYFDGRLADSAILLANEASARGLPILVDAERPRDGLDALLHLATHVVASEKFPLAWTGAPGLGGSLLTLLQRLPRVQQVTVTLGARGSATVERLPLPADGDSPALDVDEALQGLILRAEQKREQAGAGPRPVVVASKSGRLISSQLGPSDGGDVAGRVLYASAVALTAHQIVDTTGAGDAFIGAVLYALCAGLPAEKMLRLAATVAGEKCKALGSRPGLPRRTDPCIQDLLG